MALAVTGVVRVQREGERESRGGCAEWGGEGGKPAGGGWGLTLVLRLDSELSPWGALWSSLDTTHRNSAWSSLP